ncbi:hydroxymethylglutaryl-CoA reductase, partial [Lactobacillus sp. XV13L]|nr:hydroxymethylglutaryl-CoA reductase [Lactobacillus sp. XV13L]
MKFYELPPAGRRAWLRAQGVELDETDEADLLRLNRLSENVVGELQLPVGIIKSLIVNGRPYVVPMATEEPSVVAAANHGASLFARGGVSAVSKRAGIYGQIVLQAGSGFDAGAFKKEFPPLIDQANAAFASLVRHGGGVRRIEMDRQDDLVFLRVLIDPAEAMGANRANAILEFMADRLAQSPLIRAKLFAILSNYPSQLTKAQVRLRTQAVGGQATARRIALLSQIGQTDPYRAATNNKGIMNGVDSVLLATGNDTRAVEAACGVWASRDGRYRSLSSWRIDGAELVGQLTLPLALGTVGGSISARRDVQQNY